MSAHTLVPEPVRHEPADGEFVLTEATTVGAEAGFPNAASWFRASVGAATGLPLADGDPATAGISFVTDAALPDEGYALTVTPNGVRVASSTDAGAFYGAQTLRQLLGPAAFRRGPVSPGPWAVPAGVTTDEPRFPWRGCLLDVARHF
ncbi:MAG: hexosaminidase, partial [Frankiaceae bacterium]|nr:hexosaminidase [Frankiaceae bacterium]